MGERLITPEKPKVRSIRIGIEGALSSGKSTLASLVGERWGVEPVEERYLQNPYLRDFYAHPREAGISFKCQYHFLGLKAEDMKVSSVEMEEYQLVSSTSELVEIFVPSDETDVRYGKVQHDMDMMSDLEWEMYNWARTTLKRDVIVDTDLSVVLNAPPDVLYNRIIEVRGRDFEQRQFFEDNPDYLPRLTGAVADWARMEKEVGERPVILIDSANNNFASKEEDKESVLQQIETEVKKFLSENTFGRDGARLIFPDCLKTE
jgi:deoxyguanosine kinase